MALRQKNERWIDNMNIFDKKISKSIIIKMLPITCILVHITACDIAYHCREMAQFNIGMSKADVIRIMDRDPYRYSALRNTEYFMYSCRQEDAVIRFVDGKLEAYGRVRDFDLTKEAAINLNVKTDITTHEGNKDK